MQVSPIITRLAFASQPNRVHSDETTKLSYKELLLQLLAGLPVGSAYVVGCEGTLAVQIDKAMPFFSIRKQDDNAIGRYHITVIKTSPTQWRVIDGAIFTPSQVQEIFAGKILPARIRIWQFDNTKKQVLSSKGVFYQKSGVGAEIKVSGHIDLTSGDVISIGHSTRFSLP